MAVATTGGRLPTEEAAIFARTVSFAYTRVASRAIPGAHFRVRRRGAACGSISGNGARCLTTNVRSSEPRGDGSDAPGAKSRRDNLRRGRLAETPLMRFLPLSFRG